MALSQSRGDIPFASVPPISTETPEERYARANLGPQLPTAEEAFPLPTAEEAFPEKSTGIKLAPVGERPLHEYFQTGYKQGYGEQSYKIDEPLWPKPSPDASSEEMDAWKNSTPRKYLERAGLLRDVEDKHKYFIDSFNEALFLQLPRDIEASWRAMIGLVYGVSNVAVQTGIPREFTPAALFEASPEGGLHRNISAPATPRYAMPLNLDDAARLGILGDAPSTAELARRALDPRTNEVQPIGEPIAATDTTLGKEHTGGPDYSLFGPGAPLRVEPMGEGQATLINPREDIHLLARTMEPDLFRQYDDLIEQKSVFDKELDELTAQRPIAITGEPLDSTEMKFVRGYREKVVKDITDLAPRVTEAYREADRLMPVDVEDAKHTAEIVDPSVAHARGEPGEPTPTLTPAAETTPAVTPPDRLYVEPDDANPGMHVAKEGDQVVGKGASPEAATIDAVNRNYKPYTPEAPPTVTLASGETIASHVSNQLQAAGIAEDVAGASGALAEASYRTRAARFGGKLGTAEELYAREQLEIRKATPEEEAKYPKARGLFDWVKNTISLFEKADASSFIHEQGHAWLFNLIDDSMRADAPPDLVADAVKVREWLKVRGDNISVTQHEKFARGIERYIMEGQSPTPGLVRVFEQFKQWLTDLYRTVGRLRAPINDDIRSVFDRLINEPNYEPVIAPEREGALTFAEEATQAAKDTPPSEALGKADDIADTRERVAAKLSEDVRGRRNDARRGTERVSVSGEREAKGGAEPSGPGDVTADERISQGRIAAETTSETPERANDPFEQNATQYLDKAGNIRVENLDVTEDVAAAIREAAEAKNGFTEARRGRLSDIETNELADEMNMTPAKLNRWKIGHAFNAEQIIASRNLLRNTATRVRDAAAKVASGGGVEALAEYAEARERNMMVQRIVAGITAEAGRSLRAFRDMASIKDDIILSDYLQQNLKMTPEALEQEARRVSALQDPAKVNKFVRDMHDPTWTDMAVEGYVNSLLSGFFTVATNAIGNLGPVLTSPVTTATAAGISAVLDPLRGRARAVTFGEVGDRVAGIYSGSIRGASIFGNIMKDESVGWQDAAITEQRKFAAIPDVNIYGIRIPVGQAVRYPSRILMATDEFYKAIAFDQELNVQARRQARSEGLSGEDFNARVADIIKDPSDGIKALADQHSRYQTFTQDLEKSGRALQNLTNSSLGWKVLVPFIRTPVNLFKYSVEHSPLGFATQRMRNDLAGRNGEGARYEAAGKLATGTMVSIAVAGLVMEGSITGAEPTDAGELQTYRKAGYQGYSVYVGGSWYSYRRIDPIGTLIGMVADSVLISKYALTNQDEHEKTMTMVINAVANNITDKLSMRGVTTLVQAITDSARYGDSFVRNLAGSVIPGAFGQWARMEDPLMRDTRTVLDSLLARVPSKISVPFTNVSLPMPWPGRETLFPRRDRWGEPIPEEELGPIAVKQFNPTYVDTVMQHIGMNKSQPPRKIENIDLTQQQYDDYVRLEGQMSKMMLDSMITPQLVASLPPGMLKIFVNNVINEARKIAQKQVMFGSMNDPENDIVAKAMKLHMDRVLPAPDATSPYIPGRH